MPDVLTRPCSECGTTLEVVPGRGRPRITCSPRCRMVRARRKAEERARDAGRLEAFEEILLRDGSEEQQRAYADLVRSVPGFRETHDRALRRAIGAEETPEDAL